MRRIYFHSLLLVLALFCSSCDRSYDRTGHTAKAKEQVRLAVEWIRLDGEQGSFVIFESRGHSGWIQMIWAGDGHLEFDFPISVRRPKGQQTPLFYEPVSSLPEVIIDAEQDNPFTEEQIAAVRTLLKTYGLEPYSTKLVSKDSKGVIVGAIESLAFKVPSTATETFQRLVPDLFSVVHGVYVDSLDIQTGRNL